MKKIICALLSLLLLTVPALAINTLSDGDIAISAPSAVLMEKTSGEVIYEKNAHEHLSPASVTKVMTMLLIVEAIENGDVSLDDMVTASARAASFGGSCIYLKEGKNFLSATCSNALPWFPPTTAPWPWRNISAARSRPSWTK